MQNGTQPSQPLSSEFMSGVSAVRVHYRRSQGHTFSRKQRKSLVSNACAVGTLEVSTVRTPMTEREIVK